MKKESSQTIDTPRASLESLLIFVPA